MGALLGDGLGDGAVIEPDASCGADFDLSYLRDTSFALLQVTLPLTLALTPTPPSRCCRLP